MVWKDAKADGARIGLIKNAITAESTANVAAEIPFRCPDAPFAIFGQVAGSTRRGKRDGNLTVGEGEDGDGFLFLHEIEVSGLN
jgi:hypothetical protein